MPSLTDTPSILNHQQMSPTNNHQSSISNIESTQLMSNIDTKKKLSIKIYSVNQECIESTIRIIFKIDS